jgi:hypothetical protein
VKFLAKHSAYLLGFLAAALIVISPSPASGAEVGVRWHVSQLAFPSTFTPGSSPESTFATAAVPQYSAVIENVGKGPSSGTTVITETLPEGVTADPSVAPEQRVGENKPEFCSVNVATNTVTCEVEQSVESGGVVTLAIALDVAEDASASVLSGIEISGGSAPSVSSSLTTPVSTEASGFNFLPGSPGLIGTATAESGLAADLAGSHPFSVTLEGNFTTKKTGPTLVGPAQTPKDIDFQLPRGFVVNPQAPKKLCADAELVSLTEGAVGDFGCPAASQVGQITITTLVSGIDPVVLSLYDMQPPPGVPAELGFNILGTVVHIQGGLDGSFHLTADSSDILGKYPVLGIQAYLWGNPADPAHDASRRGRGGCGFAGCRLEPGEMNTAPFITMPTSCGEALAFSASAVSWEGGGAASDSAFLGDDGDPLAMEGCNALAFEPTIESKATTNVGDSPSGLEFSIHQPQDESPEGRATAALKDARVTLPEGMTLNASAANGLGSCTEEQMGYAPEGPKVQFATTPQSCPAAAKVGTLEVTTPLLGHKLPGAIYVAKPFANPFGSLLAIYLAVEDEESGIIAKLAGKVEPDPQTGRLTATFTENPELPLSDIDLHFFDGANAALKTPLTCGTATTTSTLTPWSSPEGVDVHPTDSFQTTAGCSASEAAAPKGYSFTAGTVSPLSGAYSPFVLRLSRPDGSQHITGVETSLPEGLLGKLAGVAYCPESGIAQARSREKPEQGKLEQGSPSCPSSSEVGSVSVTAGSGISPIPVSGHAYLAGPYKEAPLSLVVIVPAVAGPFDLGTVVDRVALNVGEYDASIHAVADPLPTIREGIPLDVRSIELKLDRPSFTLNPTSCEAMEIEGSASTQAGQSAPLKNRFQVGECGRLGFKPKLQISLKGPTKRTGHPALKATVTYPKGGAYANIARAQVSLPHSEFLDQGNIGKACTKPVLQAHACPTKSIYGKAKAWSPLLAAPLEGPVYLVGGYGYKLPALVAELDGQIRVLLVGKVDTAKSKGIRNTFEAVPDAPVEKFVLELKGGKKYGLLENSEDVCKKTQKAQVSLTAQNGKVLTLSPMISNSCKHGSKSKGKPGKKKDGKKSTGGGSKKHRKG